MRDLIPHSLPALNMKLQTNPQHRWDTDAGWVRAMSDGSSSAPPRFGSFLDGASSFDAGAFGMSAQEAATMDPQQRMLMECTAETLMSGWGGTAQVCLCVLTVCADAASHKQIQHMLDAQTCFLCTPLLCIATLEVPCLSLLRPLFITPRPTVAHLWAPPLWIT